MNAADATGQGDGRDDGRVMREQLVAKLRPDRFTAMSGKMAAIVGYILNEPFADPAISELVVTSDGFVLAQRSGDVGANEMLGTEADLNRNLMAFDRGCGLVRGRGPRVRSTATGPDPSVLADPFAIRQLAAPGCAMLR